MSSMLIFFFLLFHYQLYGYRLNCTTLPARPVPTNISDLHPNDIRVVMALGDSITAGFGMHNGLYEYRGSSFSIGADPGEPTIVNFLRSVGARAVGGSVGTSSPLDDVLFKNFSLIPHEPSIDHLNGAQSGARIQNLPAQIVFINDQIKSQYPEIDIQNDWKLLTILIGANDLCKLCLNDPTTPTYWEYALNAILEQVYATFPRTFVNILGMLQIPPVHYLSRPTDMCYFFQVLTDECPCIRRDNETRNFITNTTYQFNNITKKVVDQWQQKRQKDFAVTFHSFLINSKMQRENVCNVDCFHPSALSDEAIAIALWNSMLTPNAKKKTVLDLTDAPICPSKDSLLYTI